MTQARPAMLQAPSRLDRLLAYAPALLVFSLIGAGILWSPALPQDFWWQMAMGRRAMFEGAIPRSEPFSFTYAGVPIYNQSWLAQVLMFGIYSLGDLRLIVTAEALAIVVAFALLAKLCVRRGTGWNLSALLVGASIMLFVSPFLTLRPQSFALPLFPSLLLVLDNWRARIDSLWKAPNNADSLLGDREEKLWLLPLLMLLWVNMHGSFVLGLLLIGLYGAHEALRWIGAKLQPFILARFREAQGSTGNRDVADPVQRTILAPKSYLPFLFWASISFAAVLLNPYGIDIIAYVRQFGALTPVQLTLVEWQPVLLSAEVGTFIYLAVAIGLAIYAPERANWRDMLIMAVFLWLGLSRVRALLWLHIVLLPIVAGQLAQLIPQRPARAGFANRLLALVAAIILLFSLPWAHSLIGVSSEPAAFANAMTPIDAVDALSRLPERPQRLYHNLASGSYLTWALPEQPVFIYPLVEIYSTSFWQDYVDLRAGHRVEELIAKYHIDSMLLNNVENAALLEHMQHASGWRERYHDETHTLLTR